MENLQPYALSNYKHSWVVRPESGLNNLVRATESDKPVLGIESSNPAVNQLLQIAKRVVLACCIGILSTVGMMMSLVNAAWKGALLIGMTLTNRELENITKDQLKKDITRHLALFGVDFVTSYLYGITLPLFVAIYCVAPGLVSELSNALHYKVFTLLGDMEQEDDAPGILQQIPYAFGSLTSKDRA